MQFNATVGYGTVTDSGAAEFGAFDGSTADNEYVSIHSVSIMFPLSSILTAIIPREPGLASFMRAKGDGSDGEKWSS